MSTVENDGILFAFKEAEEIAAEPSMDEMPPSEPEVVSAAEAGEDGKPAAEEVPKGDGDVIEDEEVTKGDGDEIAAEEFPKDAAEGGEPPKKKARKESKKRVRRVGLVHTTKPTSPAAVAAVTMPHQIKVHSKHDEKWNQQFDKLVRYKEEHSGSTLVPQCYSEDPRLGRWVHYQRVEYWIYQSTGKGKINAERIARLESIGFEWDPQRAQWNAMVKRLEKYVEQHGNCRVPKGYVHDQELANWVRNQRLEFAHLQRGKKTRMTQDRIDILNGMGFKWSTDATYREKRPEQSAGATAAEEATENGSAEDAEAKERPLAGAPAAMMKNEQPAEIDHGVQDGEPVDAAIGGSAAQLASV